MIYWSILRFWILSLTPPILIIRTNWTIVVALTIIRLTRNWHLQAQYLLSMQVLLILIRPREQIYITSKNEMMSSRTCYIMENHTRGSTTAEAPVINMLNIKTNKPRTKRNIFVCKPMKYGSIEDNVISRQFHITFNSEEKDALKQRAYLFTEI